ncbi:MAG TPA: CRTAC1 family protein, partial [Opitutus sp.]|nr:CRTAC1 family protein [Opitutus sp.]
MNNDGRLDLYVCRVAAPNLLYVNQGDGTFAERANEAGIAVTDASVMGAFCDYDRDGWLDLYLVTNLLDYENKPQGERDRLFRNRGDGTFEDVTERAGIFGEGQKHAAVWWDHDGDGWEDVYVTYDYGWPDQLWRNNGDGTFANVLGGALPYIPRYSMGADIGDVNNDGRMDLFVLDMLPTTRERDQRAMIDARAHIPDLADPAMTPQYMRNMLFLNTGTALFQEGAFLAGIAATDWSWSARLEDFDNDGRVDLFVTNGTIREFFDGDLRKRIENLPPAERKRVFKNSPVLRERNLAYRNLGDVHFEKSSAAWGLDELGVSFGAATGDLDGDGDLDLLYSNFDGDVTLCRNEGEGGNRVVIALRGEAANRFGVGATVRIETAAGPQVRTLGIARGYLSSSEPVLHFGLGTAERIERLTVTWPGGREQTFTGLAANRRYVVTEATHGEPPAKPEKPPGQFVEVGAFLGLNVHPPLTSFDELATQPLLAFRQNQIGPGIAVGDMNGDRV